MSLEKRILVVHNSLELLKQVEGYIKDNISFRYYRELSVNGEHFTISDVHMIMGLYGEDIFDTIVTIEDFYDKNIEHFKSFEVLGINIISVNKDNLEDNHIVMDMGVGDAQDALSITAYGDVVMSINLTTVRTRELYDMLSLYFVK